MPKNVQTTVQLHSFHVLARLFSKSFKLGSNCTWTGKFQIYKLDLEKEEEQEFKPPISVGLQKRQGNSRKAYVSASLAVLKPLTMLITKNWKIPKEMGIQDHLTCLLRNLYASQEAIVETRHGTMDWFKRSTSRLYTVTLLIYLICREHHGKCWVGWLTSWN